MGCNCGKKRTYLVTKGDGSTTTTSSLSEAMKIVRQYGGKYQLQRT